MSTVNTAIVTRITVTPRVIALLAARMTALKIQVADAEAKAATAETKAATTETKAVASRTEINAVRAELTIYRDSRSLKAKLAVLQTKLEIAAVQIKVAEATAKAAGERAAIAETDVHRLKSELVGHRSGLMRDRAIVESGRELGVARLSINNLEAQVAALETRLVLLRGEKRDERVAKDAFAKLCDVLARDKGGLEVELAEVKLSAAAESRHWMEERTLLVHERDSLLLSEANLGKHRDLLLAKNQSVVGSNSRLMEDREVFMAVNHSLFVAKIACENDLKGLQQHVDQLTNEQRSLQLALVRISKEKSDLEAVVNNCFQLNRILEP